MLLLDWVGVLTSGYQVVWLYQFGLELYLSLKSKSYCLAPFWTSRPNILSNILPPVSVSFVMGTVPVPLQLSSIRELRSRGEGTQRGCPKITQGNSKGRLSVPGRAPRCLTCHSTKAISKYLLHTTCRHWWRTDGNKRHDLTLGQLIIFLGR